jgi:hypothetical protein
MKTLEAIIKIVLVGLTLFLVSCEDKGKLNENDIDGHRQITETIC